MDNVTHTLVGLVAGELAWQRTTRGDASREKLRGAFLGVSALANNFPDLDLLYTKLTEGPLGYLLHHRGHTHTFLLAPVLGVPLVLMALAWLRRRGVSLGRREAVALWGLGLFGGWLHLAFDFLNSYGVHPFWPIDGRWVFGDSIFIVEPLFWMAMAPALAFDARSSWGRVVLGIPLALSVVLVWVTGLVAIAAAFAATMFAGISTVVAFRSSSERRARWAVHAVIAVTLVFAVAGRWAEHRVEASFPNRPVKDVAVSPEPANPTCWRALAAVEEGARLRTYRLSVGTCDDLPTPWLASEASVHFWSDLSRTNCWANAFLRFARFPVVTAEDAEHWFVADARFDGGRNFTAVRFPKRPERCPENVPAWDFAAD